MRCEKSPYFLKIYCEIPVFLSGMYVTKVFDLKYLTDDKSMHYNKTSVLKRLFYYKFRRTVMPPKAKFTKEEITDIALNRARARGAPE